MRRLASAPSVVWNHLAKHSGVGIICAVAYFDPGNWSVDLQAGSTYGYKLLFIVLLSGLFAVFLQGLACKLGIVTGMNLAAHCRLLLYNRTRRPKLFRWLVLYPLYAFSEIAIISTDLAELLGSAIALSILFPALPLWAGVLLTAADVFFFLIFGDPLRGKPVRLFELLISVLVVSVLVCMCIIISKVNVDWGDAFYGFVPSKTVVQAGGLYTSVGILGATVMPHSIFLGSALATQDRADVGLTPPPPHDVDIKRSVSMTRESTAVSTPCSEDPPSPDLAVSPTLPFSAAAAAHLERSPRITWTRRLWQSSVKYDADDKDAGREPEPGKHSERENNTLAFVRAHLRHGIVNLAISLLGIAVVINALILILAAAVFRNNSQATDSLFDAATLIGSVVGHGASIVFALALLFAGQSASIVATVAGQIVSEGFLRWRVSPMFRRALTRLIGLVPSMVVAVAIGRKGIDTMLVASQVVLSIVLPFVVGPLILLTSSKTVMRVRAPETHSDSGNDSDSDSSSSNDSSSSTGGGGSSSSLASVPSALDAVPPLPPSRDTESGRADAFVDYSNSWLTIVVAVFIWTLVVVANCYVIISLILGTAV